MKIENGVLIGVARDDIVDGHFTIPEGVTRIGDRAFSCCKNLTSITIPDGVTCIDDLAFYCCASLESVTIPGSVTSIGEYAFCCCWSLTNITIPDSVTSISDGLFEGCTSLTSVTITGSVTSIGDRAFFGCASLASVAILSSVTSIGHDAFYSCTSPTSVGKYKAMSPDMSCRDYRFRLGEWSDEEPEPVLCARGYHFCTNLFDVFNYYFGEYGKDFVICECEVGDIVERSAEDSKCVTNRIKPVRVLTWQEVRERMSV